MTSTDVGGRAAPPAAGPGAGVGPQGLAPTGRGVKGGSGLTPYLFLAPYMILFTVFVAANRLSDSIRDSTYRAAARKTLPVDAVEYLRKQGPQGRLFNAYEWGGYVMHEMPQVRVFVDGRSDLYGGDFLISPYLVTSEGSPGWERELDRYKIGTVLVSRTGGLANALAASSDWRWAYADDRAVVFERR